MTIIKFIGIIIKMFYDIFICISDIVNLPYKLLGIAIGVPIILLPIFVFTIKFLVSKLKKISK